jgi:hypothetical protein
METGYIIAMVVPLIGIPAMFIIIPSYMNSLPIVDATVIDNVLRKGYTECVVSFDNKTMTTFERPCIHAVGDVVPIHVNLADDRAEIVGEHAGYKCDKTGIHWLFYEC